jgi:hypothetical protein
VILNTDTINGAAADGVNPVGNEHVIDVDETKDMTPYVSLIRHVNAVIGEAKKPEPVMVTVDVDDAKFVDNVDTSGMAFVSIYFG